MYVAYFESFDSSPLLVTGELPLPGCPLDYCQNVLSAARWNIFVTTHRRVYGRVWGSACQGVHYFVSEYNFPEHCDTANIIVLYGYVDYSRVNISTAMVVSGGNIFLRIPGNGGFIGRC